MVLVFLALVPSLALLGLWGLSTFQLGLDWQRLAKQDDLNDRSSALGRNVTVQLQEERRITGEVMAREGADPAGLLAQRQHTDDAIKAFRDSTDGTPSSLLHKQLRDALVQDRDTLAQVEGIRTAIDEGTITSPEIAFQSFTGVIASNLAFFEALGNADNGELAAAFKPFTDLMWADEMLSREDAVLTYSYASGEILDTDQSNFSQWIGTQNFLLETAVTPRVTDAERVKLQDLRSDQAWSSKAMVEAILSRHHPVNTDTLSFNGTEWRHVMTSVQPKLVAIIDGRAKVVDDSTNSAVHDLESRMRTYAVVALGAVVVVITLSVLLTGSLRRRILALRDEAARLETELPAVMARLRRGEDVDVDMEVREVEHGRDEMGELGKALNLARRSAVETAVRETEQHRGFQRMLQRIARRTQLLIGLQLKKLDEMERGQEDPEVLEGLFDLDHLTSRLRRYEENLVVLGGGQPQRRWRRPVRVIDVMRAALGEVQDYRRIRIDVAESPWLYGRAVGSLVHILAELMENAAAFSRPPSPVEARAALVGRGLAVEIEDRGLGMDAEEYQRVNRMMTEPPEPDMVSRAEDARLGLYVVARLAAGLGLGVEFRPSAFGGTRVVVMIPAELVAEPPEDAEDTPTPPSPLGAAAGSGGHTGVRSGDRGGAAAVGHAVEEITADGHFVDEFTASGHFVEEITASGYFADEITASGHFADEIMAGGRFAEETAADGHAAQETTDLAPAPAVPKWALTAQRAAPGYGRVPEYGGASDQVAPSDGDDRHAARRRTDDRRTDGGWEGYDHDGTGAAAGARPPRETSQPDRAGQPAHPGHGWALHPPPAAHEPLEHARAEASGPHPDAPVPTPPAAPNPTGPLPGLPGRARGRALDAVTARQVAGASTTPGDGPPGGPMRDAPGPAAAGGASGPGSPDAPPPDGLSALPRRVRQAHLAPGLKEPPKRSRRPAADGSQEPPEGTRTARSSATIGAFQRQSRLSRGGVPRTDQAPAGPTAPGDATPETRSNHTEDAP